MGDVLSLIERVEQTIDQKTAEKMQEKLLGDDFTLEGFRSDVPLALAKFGLRRLPFRHLATSSVRFSDQPDRRSQVSNSLVLH